MPYNSDGSHQDNNRVGLGGLWQQTDKNGNKYLSGSLGFAKLLIFPNRNKTHDNQPDYSMVLVEKQRKEDDPQRGKTQPQPLTDDDLPF